MKIRCDFVSNSSGSSFICTREDLATIDVYGDVCSISLKEFLCQYWRRDVLGYFRDPDKSSIKFVSDKDFSKNFGYGSYHVLPKSIEDLIDEYIYAYDDAKNDHTDNRQAKWQNVHDIENKIANALYDILAPEWDNVDLVEIIATDDPKDDSEWNDEEHMIDSFSSLQNPKFYRVYNNH